MDQRAKLSNITSSELRLMLGKNKILFIDEAQRIKNIGLTIKLITDHIKDVQVVTTPKSSYEPMRSRKAEKSTSTIMASGMPSSIILQHSNPELTRAHSGKIS